MNNKFDHLVSEQKPWEEIRKILDDMPITDAEKVGLLEAIKFDILTDMREES